MRIDRKRAASKTSVAALPRPKARSQARRVLRALRKLYPKADIQLRCRTPLDVAVAVILSAQCTDKRVNIVTKELFKKYRTPKDYANSKPGALEGMIRSTGFYRSKAKSIREMSKALIRNHRGRLPGTMDELLKLRGVARKTANVILGTVFGKTEGVVVDTHVKRLAYRMGLTARKDPVRVERDLMACLPRSEWRYFSHGMILHGRRVCSARKPDCAACTLRKFCPKRGVSSGTGKQSLKNS